ncbi:uncharacterized protein cubi_03356 [Cryptosporidium ubiquitum]|uniref:Uncharacterized protein n=1 Tax=Cryptosporidium ubiquitum TaxID=857276 RepID=A0A1J4MH51_9CRYT|nr:uncharacterized protein cubi_03356 [Cryptosporidium ubiquitum]OII73558.1 hypothetical protein cubi_03356 [Cryptosporidium ubiquitum]
MKLYTRDSVIKHMSEIFSDIPDVIIGDIFDYLVKENLKLCKKSNHAKGNSYENEMIEICNHLYEKLSEISIKESYNSEYIHFQESSNSCDFDRYNLDLDNNINFNRYLNLNVYFNQIQNHGLDFYENEFFDQDNKMSYLSVCSQNKQITNNNLNSLKNTNLQRELLILKKRPWNIFQIQSELISHEMNMFSNILNRIFNSPRLFKVKESKNKKWPPEGPGNESSLIPIKEININSKSKESIEQIEFMQNQIRDLNLSLELKHSELNRIINQSNISEYKSIKIQEFKKKIQSIKIERLNLQKSLFNLVFNSQNSSFIDFFSTKSNHDSKVVIDLHNFNRNEAISLVIFSIIMILKYRFQTDLEKVFSKNSSNFEVNQQELESSQKSFKGNFIDIYFCVGIGNHNHLNGNIDPPKLASLIRRISFALNLTWRFGSIGFIILRIQDNINWYRFIQKFLE